jgi:hypothetical protein
VDQDPDFLKLCAQAFDDHVELLFRNLKPVQCGCGGALIEAPVIGGLHRIEDLSQVKNKAAQALAAQRWWNNRWPAPLPVSEEAIAALRQHPNPWCQLLGYYAASLRAMNFDFKRHPRFYVFCEGLFASPNAPWHLRHHHGLLGAIDPCPLPGLDDETLRWEPLESVAPAIPAPIETGLAR